MVILATNCKHLPFPGPEVVPVDTTTTKVPVDTTHHVVVKDPCSPDSAYFQKDIWPIIASNCAKAGCHDANTAQNGISYTGYNSVVAKVKPGNPGGSKLYSVITGVDDRMPPASQTQLTSAQIALIYKWIKQGAKNNTCTDTTCNANNFKFANDILPLLKMYCQGCHNGSATGGNVSLLTYSDISVQAANGKLYNDVNHTTGYNFMPLGSPKLSNCQISQIKNWIDAGYPNN